MSLRGSSYFLKLIALIKALIYNQKKKKNCLEGSVVSGKAKVKGQGQKLSFISMPNANNKGTDQPAHLRSLISTFVVRCLDSIMYLVSILAIS